MLDATLDEFGVHIFAELDRQWRERSRARVAEVGRQLLWLVAAGHSSVNDFDEANRESVIEAVRFSLDALCDEAVPAIARLSQRRPVDHFFRGTCRVLVDLDTGELAKLTDVIASAARNLPELFSATGVTRAAMPTIALHRAVDRSGADAVHWDRFPDSMMEGDDRSAARRIADPRPARRASTRAPDGRRDGRPAGG